MRLVAGACDTNALYDPNNPSVCELECAEGYIADGSGRYECTANGTSSKYAGGSLSCTGPLTELHLMGCVA